MSTRKARKIAAITMTVVCPPLMLWWIRPTEQSPSIMATLFDLDRPDAEPEQPRLSARHATQERENVYVPGIGWCKPQEPRHD